MQAFLSKREFWIGLRKHDNLWLWVNGEYAAPAAIYWQNNELDNSGLNRHCARIRGNQNKGRVTIKGHCSLSRIALCEKKYSPKN